MISERETELEAMNAELTTENHALHAELVKARELVDMCIVLATSSRQEADIARARLAELQAGQAKRSPWRPRKVNPSAVLHTMTLLIRDTKDPSKRDLNRVMKDAAAVHGITKERVRQIVEAAMKQSGISWK
jgi:hypothetical protein